MTTEEWALVSAPRGRPSELYHLGDDPQQTRNVLPEHPDVARELHGRLLRFLETAGGSGATAARIAPFQGDVTRSGAEPEPPAWRSTILFCREDARGVTLCFDLGGPARSLFRARTAPFRSSARSGRATCASAGHRRWSTPHPVRLALRSPLSRPPLSRPRLGRPRLGRPRLGTSRRPERPPIAGEAARPVRRAVQAFRSLGLSVADAARSCSTSANQPSSATPGAAPAAAPGAPGRGARRGRRRGGRAGTAPGRGYAPALAPWRSP